MEEFDLFEMFILVVDDDVIHSQARPQQIQSGRGHLLHKLNFSWHWQMGNSPQLYSLACILLFSDLA
jgi:hypothetical protein